MKTGFLDIIGETVAGVVIKRGPKPPTLQLFLVLSGDRHFEFYTGKGEIVEVENPRLRDSSDYVSLGVLGREGEVLGLGRSQIYPPSRCRSRAHVAEAGKGEGALSFANMEEMPGRRVVAVVNRQAAKPPYILTIFLDDATFVEFISDCSPFNGCGQIDRGGLMFARTYLGPEWTTVYEALLPEVDVVLQ
jgi:hypothetical protein